jgi:zinc transport system substrate-binding protein
MHRSLALPLALLAACTPGDDRDGRVTVVASVYPLAFVAERVGGPAVEVIDLTPPGSDAHDVELSLDDRTAIEGADVVAYLGPIGFQPQVEAAVLETEARVADYSAGRPGIEDDPHVWLWPRFAEEAAEGIVDALGEADPAGRDGYQARYERLFRETVRLEGELAGAIQRCTFTMAIVTHEAFGALLPEPYRQLGLSGPDPEGEPTVDRLRQAEAAVSSGQAGAVFYEETDEGRRVGRAVAGDLGVRALPLWTLESRPASGDYFSRMRDNIRSLKEGLGCQGPARLS